MYFYRVCDFLINRLNGEIKYIPQIGKFFKANILKADYSRAEKYCPQKIQIGRVLKKTYEDLT
jgi:hypothetical protein